jgi:hypothetical protein
MTVQPPQFQVSNKAAGARTVCPFGSVKVIIGNTHHK